VQPAASFVYFSLLQEKSKSLCGLSKSGMEQAERIMEQERYDINTGLQLLQ